MSKLLSLLAVLVLQGGGSLGVRVSDLEPLEAASSAITNLHGAVVRDVARGSAAERAGIHQKDIITGVAGQAVGTASELVASLSHRSAGETIVLSIVRPGRKLPYPRLSVRVVLGGSTARVISVTPPTRTTTQRGLRTTESGGAVSVTPKESGRCHALAPADWTMGARDVGDAVDMMSGDRRNYAGWSIRGVNRAMQPYYGDLYGDVETSSRYLIGMVGQTLGDGGPYHYTGQAHEIGAGFVARELASAGHKAIIVYRQYPPPMGFSNDSYIISLRLAIVPNNASQRAFNNAIAVAASVNCSVQFVAPRNNDIPLPRPGDAFDRRRRSETGDLTDYNVQLGSQYAHSPTTGQNYLLDRASQWNDNGPDGPGYYRPTSTGLEKLVPGIQ